jgi:uncharacterized membrane protein YfcA
MPLTNFLAQVIGLLLLSMGISMLFQKKVFMTVLNDITENRTTLFMVGVVLFLCGLSIVLTHNIWNAGFLPLVISLIGWVLMLRGLASMFMPGHSITRIMQLVKVEEFSWAYGILVLVIGAYLTYAGFSG